MLNIDEIPYSHVILKLVFENPGITEKEIWMRSGIGADPCAESLSKLVIYGYIDARVACNTINVTQRGSIVALDESTNVAYVKIADYKDMINLNNLLRQAKVNWEVYKSDEPGKFSPWEKNGSPYWIIRLDYEKLMKFREMNRLPVASIVRGAQHENI